MRYDISMDLNTPVASMPAVNEKVAAGLNYLKIRKLRDLLFYFPTRHEDRRTVTEIKDIVAGTPGVMRGKIENVKAQATFRRMGGRARRVLVTKAVLRDKTGAMPIIWFHQRFIEKNFPAGTEVVVVGTPTLGEAGIALYFFTGEYPEGEGEPQPSDEGLAEWISFEKIGCFLFKESFNDSDAR